MRSRSPIKGTATGQMGRSPPLCLKSLGDNAKDIVSQIKRHLSDEMEEIHPNRKGAV